MMTATEILSAAFPTASIKADGVAATAKVAGRTYTVAVYATGAISAARGPHGLFLKEETAECAIAALQHDAPRALLGLKTTDKSRTVYV
jgi:hypothetical protein